MRKAFSPTVWVLLCSSLLLTSCQLAGFGATTKPDSPVAETKSLAQVIVDEYVNRLSTTDLSRGLERASLSYISNADLAVLKTSILNKINTDGLLTSSNVSAILGSMMKGVTAGVVALGSGSMANDTRAGSVLVAVAIKSSVQSLVARPDSVPPSTLKDVIGTVVKNGVTSLSVVSQSDVVSLQRAIVQSVQDVVVETKATTLTAVDAVGIAVSATVSVASDSTANKALKSADLMQAAFSGASAAFKAANPQSTTLSKDLQTVVVESIKSAQVSQESGSGASFTADQAENILVQAAAGLTSDGAGTDVSKLLTEVAAEASSDLSLTVDASTAVEVAAETVPTASFSVNVAGQNTSTPLPYQSSGYVVNLDTALSTQGGTTISVSSPGLVLTTSTANLWTASIRSPGTYTFYLKVANTSGAKAAYMTASVSIANPVDQSVAVTSVSLDATTLTLSLDAAPVKLVATVAPASATNNLVTWATSDSTIVAVDGNGKISVVGVGTAVVSVKTADQGKVASATVTVKAIAVDTVVLDKTSLTMTLGDSSTKLIPTFTPLNATDKSATWSSSNPAVAVVDTIGRVMAKSAGTATITVTSNSGKKTASATITVQENTTPVTGVSLDKTELQLTAGDPVAVLVATVSPPTATLKTVVWSTSNSLVASVDNTGQITPKTPGTATITVTSNSGKKTATASITVQEKKTPVTGVSLDKTELQLIAGDPVAVLVATVSPPTATLKTVVWSTSNSLVANVDGNGQVTPKAAGTVTITATTQDGGKKAVATVTVLSNGKSTGVITIETPPAKMVTISGPSPITLSQGVVLFSTTFSGTPQSYEWYWDGESLGAVGSTLELNSANLAVGKHLITVFVTDASKLTYSGSFDLWVAK